MARDGDHLDNHSQINPLAATDTAIASNPTSLLHGLTCTPTGSKVPLDVNVTSSSGGNFSNIIMAANFSGIDISSVAYTFSFTPGVPFIFENALLSFSSPYSGQIIFSDEFGGSFYFLKYSPSPPCVYFAASKIEMYFDSTKTLYFSIGSQAATTVSGIFFIRES